MREDDIRLALEGLDGDTFEKFVWQLVARESYPALVPTSRSNDLGEDARTEPSGVFTHGGKRISLAASKTSTITKIREDCEQCKKKSRPIDILVFVTSGKPQTATEKRWKRLIKKEFGWDLEVRTIRWLAPTASKPEYESLVDSYLRIPPPDGDYTNTIENEFAQHTERATRKKSTTLPGIGRSLERDEIQRIEEQLGYGNAILLTGEAGTGKSGIAVALANRATEDEKAVLLLDARRLHHVNSETDLRHFLDLQGSVATAIQRLGRHKGCRVIIDQFDAVLDLPSGKVIADLLHEYRGEGVEMVLISRRQDIHNSPLIKELQEGESVELTSHPLDEGIVKKIYDEMGIQDPPDELVDLGTNLLNLEIIGRIKEAQPDYDFSSFDTEVAVWEQYYQTVHDRETANSDTRKAGKMLADAAFLAGEVLRGNGRTFTLPDPPALSYAQLKSWQIIVQDEGLIHTFYHEELQDFIYARHAAERGLMPPDVLDEINPHRSKDIFRWMLKIYQSRNSDRYSQFARAALDVK